MRAKRISLLLIFVIITTVLTGCAVHTSTAGDVDKTIINIATGSTGGTYYQLGNTLAKVYNDNIKNIIAKVLVTEASNENIKLVSTGESEIAFVQNDVMYYAYTGTEIFTDNVDNIRGLAMLYPEVIQVVASKDSGIKEISDLKGKRISVGPRNSGTEINARQILNEYGIDYSDLEKVDFLSFEEASTQLKEKNIDAAFITAGLPTPSVSDLFQSNDFTLIPISIAYVRSLVEKYNFYSEVIIPANTYNNQKDKLTSVAVKAMLIVPQDLDESVAYNLTKYLFEQRKIIADSHQQGKEIKLQTALVNMPINLHPGAQRYYNEKGAL